MEPHPLLFWRSGPKVSLSSAEIARELVFGEEVDGLVDLPVREIIDRLRAEFPQHEEKPGMLIGRVGSGRFEATWTWQHFQVELHDLDAVSRERLIACVESFGCMAYEASPGRT